MAPPECIVGGTRAQRGVPRLLRNQLRQPRGRGLKAGVRVAIEAGPLAMASGGLARYTAELSAALARCFPEDEFFLVSDQPFRMPESALPNLKRGGGPRNAMERRWWLWGIAREMKRLG